MTRYQVENLPPHFSGLWLCRKAFPREGVTFRSALLFAEGNEKLYILRLNHFGLDKDGVTLFFLWDYIVEGSVIHEHPLSYPDELVIEVPWRRAADDALVLQFDRGEDLFYPATWSDVFALGFERREVTDALRELKDLGATYSLRASVPQTRSSRS